MKDRFGQILYVGKAKNLKKRVSTYFQPSRQWVQQQPKIAAMIPLIHDIEIIEVQSETEALLLEGKLIKTWKPRYNTDFTDNKQFLLVRVDVQEPLPRFRLTRNRREDGSRYFGPFAHSGLLRKTLHEMRRKFGILLADAAPRQMADSDPAAPTWQLYNDARAELYGHANFVTAAEYQSRVEAACTFLEGKSKAWLKELKAAMSTAASERNYEKAAELRDMIQALRRTTQPNRKFTRLQLPKNPTEQVLADLKAYLGLRSRPRTIECFDISHISGTFVVASMVQFLDGLPNKAQYRQYKIKSFVGNDDFRAMQEVVGRRYQRLVKEQKPLPDLIVIDGGIGQVHAALQAFADAGLEPPPLIGLAKREETIVFAQERADLQLPGHDPARQLLQRIRDEAHRVANSFNAALRSQRIRESILDDLPGLGTTRRQALMRHFKTLANLRKASAEELRAVEGIGPKLAAQLIEFLRSEE